MKHWKPDDDNGTHPINFKEGHSITLDIPTDPPLKVDDNWMIIPRSSTQVSLPKYSTIIILVLLVLIIIRFTKLMLTNIMILLYVATRFSLIFLVLILHLSKLL